MSPLLQSPSKSESRLVQVLDEYLAAVQAGQAPSKEELLARYPELADDLAECLASLDFIRQSAVMAVPDSSGDVAPRPLLGDFRILREIGRGGMGVVYEAEQVSLGRHVALKVLPFAGALDARQLQRFKNEAHAAAQLHHTNIVPVHYVGSERGVHFYAMQFIEGQTLAEIIRDLRHQRGLASRVALAPGEVEDPGSKPEAALAQRRQAAESPLAPSRLRESEDQQALTQDYQPAKSTIEARVTATDARSSILNLRSSIFFRTIAQLGIQAAEALEHAHQLGIIHRDIKPGNLLVEFSPSLLGGEGWGEGHKTRSSAPRLCITDFGLARLASQGGEAGVNLTVTGDLVGTLRYMSPEQALAKRVIVDHRTDIYSLGATIYELLTLQPAYAGNDRQELLRQIAFEEPKLLRRINKSIPPELETIVLKSMEKNPGDRYATAQELADDLRRYLLHEPIRARRPTLVQRTTKWCRRHRPWVAGASAIVIAVFLMATAWWWVHQRDRAIRRTETERGVNAALVETELFVGQGWQQMDDPDRWQATVGLAGSAMSRAEELLAAGVGSRDLADRVGDARAKVDEASRASRLRAELERIRLEAGTAVDVKESHFDSSALPSLYESAFHEYGIDTSSPDEASALLLASPLREVMLASLEDWTTWSQDSTQRRQLKEVQRLATPEMNPLWEQWRAARARLDADALSTLSRNPQLLQLPSTALLTVVLILEKVGKRQDAERFLRSARERFPNDFWINHNLGMMLRTTGKPKDKEEAVRFLTAAQALRPRNAGVCLNLGNALRQAGEADAAIRCFRKALELSPEYANVYRNIGDTLLNEKQDPDTAIGAYRKAVEFNPTLHQAHFNLGTTLLEKGDLDGAIESFHAALKVKPDFWESHANLAGALYRKGRLDESIAASKEAIRLKSDCMEAYGNLASALATKGLLDEAINLYQKAIRIKPESPQLHGNLGGALDRKGRLEEAIVAFQEAIRLKPDYTQAHHALATIFLRKARLDEAIAHFREAVRLRPDYVSAHRGLGLALSEKLQLDDAITEYRITVRLNPKSAEAHFDLARALFLQKQFDEAITKYREAISLNENYAEAHCNLGHALQRQGRFSEALAEFKRGHELGSRNPRWDYPSAQWVRETALMADLDPKLPMLLKGQVQLKNTDEQLACASMCQHCKNLHVAAVGFYRQAFQSDPKYAETLPSRRYDAACSAALAGAGQGADGAKLEDKERADLRKQALQWLKSDLAGWRKELKTNPDKARAKTVQIMRHWQQDTDLAAVRGAALAKLPETERADWQNFWDDVEKTMSEGGTEKKNKDTPNQRGCRKT